MYSLAYLKKKNNKKIAPRIPTHDIKLHNDKQSDLRGLGGNPLQNHNALKTICNF